MTIVRCQCGKEVGRAERRPDGLWFRSLAHDVQARMAEKTLEEDYGLKMEAPQLTVRDGPDVPFECPSHGALSMNQARVAKAIANHKDAYLKPFHQHRRAST